jgi:hypothetical protein
LLASSSAFFSLSKDATKALFFAVFSFGSGPFQSKSSSDSSSAAAASLRGCSSALNAA